MRLYVHCSPIAVTFRRAGVTQELIEETRQATETAMLADLRQRISAGADLEFRGPAGETPVSKQEQ